MKARDPTRGGRKPLRWFRLRDRSQELRTKAASGFTLIELLVAVAITLVLVAVLVAASAKTLDLWRRTQDGWTTAAEAKLALDALERDLQGALFRPDGGAWMAVDVIDSAVALTTHGWLSSGFMKPAGAESRNDVPPSGLADARFGLSGAWLRFVTTNLESTSSSRPGGSLPVVVAYQLVRRPSSGTISTVNPARVRYALYRSAVTGEATFENGHDVLASAYGSTSNNPPATRTPRTVTNPNSSDVIATNVVDFGVWLHARDPSGNLVRIFPTTAQDSTHAARAAAEFPAVVDVMVRVLTNEGANRLEQLEQSRGTIRRPASVGSDAEWWWSVVLEHSRVHGRRIEIKSDVP